MSANVIQGARVLVTGGAGFIGSHLCEALAADNEVHVVDNLSTGHREYLQAVRCQLHVADVADPEIHGLFHGIDVVFHLAAQVSVDRSVRDPLADARANVLGTVNVLEAARRAGVRRVVFSSSSAVYGNGAVNPTPEAAALTPETPYAASKVAGEHYLQMYERLHGLGAIALRYFNVYGPRQDPSSPYAGVISLFADRAGRGLPLTVHGDGKQTRDFVAVEDVIRANLLAAKGELNGTFNVGTGISLTINQLADICAAGRVAIEHGPARPGDVRDSRSDATRARDVLGFVAEIAPDDGIRRYLARGTR